MAQADFATADARNPASQALGSAQLLMFGFFSFRIHTALGSTLDKP